MGNGSDISKKIEVVLSDKFDSQGGFKRTIEGLDDVGKALNRSEKESSKRELMMEKAARAGEKAIDKTISKKKQEATSSSDIIDKAVIKSEKESSKRQSMMEKVARAGEKAISKTISDRKKSEESISNLEKRQKTFDKIERDYGLTQAETSKAMSAGGLRMKQNGDITNLAGKKMENYGDTLMKGSAASQRFNMNALGVMFAGMALNRTMGNLNATSREWVGMNDLMGTMMGVVTLPATMDLLNLGVIPLFTALTTLPEAAQYAIGTATYALQGLGGVMMVGGQLMLGLESTINMLARFGDGNMMAGISKVAGHLKTFAKYAVAGILIGVAIKDFNEGQFVAALGDTLAAAGIMVGGPGGIAMMAVGVTLKLLGDEDFLVSVLKTMYKIGTTLNSIIKEAVVSAFTFRDFNVDNIDGVANVGRAFQRAIEEIQIEEAGKGIFDVIAYPEGTIDAIQEDIDRLDKELKDDIISKEDYVAKLGPLVEKQEEWIRRWRAAYEENIVGNAEIEKEKKNTELSGLANFATSPGETIAKTFSWKNMLYSLAGVNTPKAIGGNIGSSGSYYLHEGETVLRKDQANNQSGNISVTYNVNVSDKREFEQMLRANNDKLTADVRRMSQV